MLGITEVSPGGKYLMEWMNTPTLMGDLGRRIVEELGHDQIVPVSGNKKRTRSMLERHWDGP